MVFFKGQQLMFKYLIIGMLITLTCICTVCCCCSNSNGSLNV